MVRIHVAKTTNPDEVLVTYDLTKEANPGDAIKMSDTINTSSNGDIAMGMSGAIYGEPVEKISIYATSVQDADYILKDAQKKLAS